MKRPFRLGTTSFIVPDHIIPNVEKLGPWFDEIELLVFESIPDKVLPSKADVSRLKLLAHQYGLTYNIHLPTDVSLTSCRQQDRNRACERLLTVMERFSPLTPTTHTLHLEMPKAVIKSGDGSDRLKQWQDAAFSGLDCLTRALQDPGVLSVETLDYPFVHADAAVEAFGLNVCIDAGHQIKYGFNLSETYERYREKIPLIHLHGVDFSGDYVKDHTSLDRLPPRHLETVRTLLETFTGVVSLEVFRLDCLNRSLAVLSRMFEPVPGHIGIK